VYVALKLTCQAPNGSYDGHTEMGIKVVGWNHRTAPLDVRERFAHGAHEVPGALARVMAAGASGGVLLSTCNRTEFYLVADDEPALEAVWSLLGERLPTSGPRREGRGSTDTSPATVMRSAISTAYRRDSTR